MPHTDNYHTTQTGQQEHTRSFGPGDGFNGADGSLFKQHITDGWTTVSNSTCMHGLIRKNPFLNPCLLLLDIYKDGRQ